MAFHITTKDDEEGVVHVERLGVGGFGEVHKVFSRRCAMSLKKIDE
jgi:hypothetical protein